MPVRHRIVRKTVPNFVTVFRQSALRGSALELRRWAEEFAQALKSVIRKQLFDWKPLSPEYAKYKERKGLDPRILVATGDYVDAIGVHREETRTKGVIYRVGFAPGAIHEPSGLPYNRLAHIHEFGVFTGTAEIPARPHWRPTIARFKLRIPRVKKGIVRRVLKEFERNSSRRVRRSVKRGVRK